MNHTFKPGLPTFFVNPLMPAIADVTGMPAATVASALSVPPSPSHGDVALPCFELARLRGASPALVAAHVAEALGSLQVTAEWPVLRTVAQGPYVNLHLDRVACATALLTRVEALGGEWAQSHDGDGQRVCIDFCSPNIAKPLHLGHLRSSVIGSSLARIYAYAGYDVVRINYLGDWGTSLGKLMVAWKRWGSAAAVAADAASELLRVYVQFSKEAEVSPGLQDEAREMARGLECGESEVVALWGWLRSLCMSSVESSLARLGVDFDVWDAESLREPELMGAIGLVRSLGLLVESEGALVVELEGMPPCLLLRSDGATLYATRDLATALHRQAEYAPARSLYVVDNGQAMHFTQLFAVLRKMGFAWVEGLSHVGFGVMRVGGRRLRTREGELVYLDDILDDAVSCATRELVSRSPDMEGLDEAASAIGIGAVIFNDLKHSREQDVDFSPGEALSFEGETGPYVQYAHARCCSILSRSGRPDASPATTPHAAFSGDAEWALVRDMAAFPGAMGAAVEGNAPHVIARAVLDVAKSLNRFYRECPVLRADEATARARLSIVAATAITLRQGLWLLGISAPRMREDREQDGSEQGSQQV